MRRSDCAVRFPRTRSSSKKPTPSSPAEHSRKRRSARTPAGGAATATRGGPGRRDAVEPDRHQSRSSRCRGRGRLPHRLRPVRPSGRARAEGARGGARPARPQAEAARGLLHVGQQGCIPEGRACTAVRRRPSRRSGLEQSRHHGPADLPRRALVHGSDDGHGSRRRRSRGRRLAARSRIRRCGIRRRGGRGRRGPRSEPRKLRRATGAEAGPAEARRRAISAAMRSTSVRGRLRVSKPRCSKTSRTRRQEQSARRPIWRPTVSR